MICIFTIMSTVMYICMGDAFCSCVINIWSVSYHQCLMLYLCSIVELHTRYDNHKATKKSWTTSWIPKPTTIKTNNCKLQCCRKLQNRTSKSKTLKNQSKNGWKPPNYKLSYVPLYKWFKYYNKLLFWNSLSLLNFKLYIPIYTDNTSLKLSNEMNDN